MPIDEVSQLKQAILEAVRLHSTTLNSRWGIEMPGGANPTIIHPFSEQSFESVAEQFGTGYDGGTGTTTVPFVLDLSILYASGTGDILTA